jgi:hypothetical protein
MALHDELFRQLGAKVPAELLQAKAAIEARLATLG